MASSSVHVVSKSDNAKHSVCQTVQQFPELPPSSIRVHTQLISLTSNNLTYARNGGPPLNWWDVYPVPESSPAPFNNRDEWGIVPAWGYAKVVESTIDAMGPGLLLWGMWPASGHTVELQLVPSEPAGHWTETSPHRSKLLTVYNKYMQNQASNRTDLKTASLFRPLWGGPNTLNTSTFSDRRIHPSGFGMPWSAEDADLSSAVVINLSASSKTARSFFWELARNRDIAADGPLGLLQLTSAPETLPSFDTKLPVKAATYSDADVAKGVSWAAQFKPSRLVIVDFGASDATLQSLLTSVKEGSVAVAVTVIAVGFENKVYTEEEFQARRAASVSKVQLNASGLRDYTIRAIGAEKYYREADETWKRCVADKTFSDIKMKTLNAVEGSKGIEGTWSDLCNRKVPPSVGLVIDLSE